MVLLRDVLDAVERSLADLERRIFDAVKRDYELPWTLLQTLPGAGPLAAAALLAEVGDDMETFGTARRLASWAGMCPGNNESAGKSKGGKRRKGNVYPRRILCEITQSAARTRDVQFGPYKRGLAIRRGTGRAVMATAHKIDPAHRVRDAPRRQAVPRSAADRLPGAHGDQEQGTLAEEGPAGLAAGEAFVMPMMGHSTPLRLPELGDQASPSFLFARGTSRRPRPRSETSRRVFLTPAGCPALLSSDGRVIDFDRNQ